jgi:tight adherence protein B
MGSTGRCWKSSERASYSMNLSLDPETTIAVGCGLAVTLLIWLIASALRDSIDGRRFQRRLSAVQDRARGLTIQAETVQRSLARRQSATPHIDRIARQLLPRRDVLAARLARTGRSISVGQYFVGIIGLSLLSAAGLMLGASLGIIPDVLIGFLIGLALPHFVIGRMGKRRVAAFVALFPEAIDLMVRALRSGLPISEAIIGAGREIAGPVGAELARVEAGLRLGRELESLLWDIAARIDVPEFRFFIIALSVQRETGGNLAETLANLGDVLRRRRQMQAKIRAMSSETRATTMILAGLPVVVVVALAVTSPAYLVPLYSDVRGYFLDALALMMLATGIGIMNKMARFEI